MNTKSKIEKILKQELTIQSLEVIDDSHLHAGHSQAKGGGHFTVLITSDDFKGKSPLERHRLIYKTLHKELQSEIHALSIQAFTADEKA